MAEGTFCASPHVLSPTSEGAIPEAEAVEAPLSVARGVSRRSIDTARAIGALPFLEALAKAEASGATAEEVLDVRQQINDAIAAASLDLSSTIAMLECEADRARNVSDALEEAEEAQVRNITTDALVVSALAAIGAGLLTLRNEQDTKVPAIVGIGGGVASLGLGAGALAVHNTVRFVHARNVLGEIWRGDAHAGFAESVWAFVTRPEFTKTGEHSLREWLAITWRRSGRLGDPEHPSQELVDLYFGEGGTYDADGLENRAAMLSELRSTIELMQHELRHLAVEASSS
jgi:hypothetical protein